MEGQIRNSGLSDSSLYSDFQNTGHTRAHQSPQDTAGRRLQASSDVKPLMVFSEKSGEPPRSGEECSARYLNIEEKMVKRLDVASTKELIRTQEEVIEKLSAENRSLQGELHSQQAGFEDQSDSIRGQLSTLRGQLQDARRNQPHFTLEQKSDLDQQHERVFQDHENDVRELKGQVKYLVDQANRNKSDAQKYKNDLDVARQNAATLGTHVQDLEQKLAEFDSGTHDKPASRSEQRQVASLKAQLAQKQDALDKAQGEIQDLQSKLSGMKQEVKSAETKSTQTNQRIKTLEGQLKQLEEDKQKLGKKFDSSSRTASRYRSERNALKNEKEQLQQDVETKTTEVGVLSTKFQTKEAELDSVKGQVKTLSEERSELSTLLKQKGDELARVNRELSDRRENDDTRSQKYIDLQRQATSLEEEVGQLTADKQGLEKQLDRAGEGIGKLQEELQSVNEQKADAEKAVESLREQLLKTDQAKTADMAHLSAQLESKESELNDVHLQVTQLKGNLADRENKLSEARQKLEARLAVTETFSSGEVRPQDLQQVKRLESEIKTLTTDKESLKLQLDTAWEEQTGLSVEMESLQIQLEAAQNAEEIAKATIERLEGKLTDYDTGDLHRQVESHSTEMHQLLDQFGGKGSGGSWSAKMGVPQEAVVGFGMSPKSHSLPATGSEYARQPSESEEIAKLEVEKKQLQSKVEVNDRRVAELSLELQRLESDSEELLAEKDDLQSKIAGLQVEKESLQDKLQKAEGTIDELNQQIEQTLQDSEFVKIKEAFEREGRKFKVDDFLLKRNGELSGETVKLERMLAEEKGEAKKLIANLENQIRELEMKTDGSEFSEEIQDIRGQLGDLQSKLKQAESKEDQAHEKIGSLSEENEQLRAKLRELEGQRDSSKDEFDPSKLGVKTPLMQAGGLESHMSGSLPGYDSDDKNRMSSIVTQAPLASFDDESSIDHFEEEIVEEKVTITITETTYTEKKEETTGAPF